MVGKRLIIILALAMSIAGCSNQVKHTEDLPGGNVKKFTIQAQKYKFDRQEIRVKQ
ncbi:MAG: hypothetical protein K6T85_05600 [Gorillibacterium sp.]|nr:hypothetical protein [Gorillibacterium sp.]